MEIKKNQWLTNCSAKRLEESMKLPLPVSVSFRVVGKDPRILSLPSLVDLPVEDGWKPHVSKQNRDRQGNPLSIAGVQIVSCCDSRDEAHGKLLAWLRERKVLLQSLDATHKWIQVETRVWANGLGSDGFLFTVQEMQEAVEADCCLACVTYNIEPAEKEVPNIERVSTSP